MDLVVHKRDDAVTLCTSIVDNREVRTFSLKQ